MNKYTIPVFREKFHVYFVCERTIRKFVDRYWEELEERGLIEVGNKLGLRKSYKIIRPILLKRLMEETYVPNRYWELNPED